MRAVVFAVAVVLCFLTTLSGPSIARAQTMQFVLEPPHQPIQIFGNAWNIFGDGEIEQTSAARLVEAIKKNNIPRNSMIYLNSPGGDLAGGMELGRTIRKYGLFTQVAKRGPMETTGDFRSFKVLPSGCFSACTLAYIGGVFRWMNSKSVYGVHRFYGDGANADNAQVASSIIIQYIRDMDVDPALFSEMTKAGRDEINAVPHLRLEALNVINNGQGKTRWTIEGTGDGLYLKGERDTSNGINKFILLCKQGRLSLYVVFDPVGRGEEILTLHGAQSLMIDGEAMPASHLREGEVTLQNGWVNAFYNLTPDLTNKIKQAKTVGIAFQFVYGAPVFLGFDHMEIGDGRPKVAGFISSCR